LLTLLNVGKKQKQAGGQQHPKKWSLQMSQGLQNRQTLSKWAFGGKVLVPEVLPISFGFSQTFSHALYRHNDHTDMH